MQIKIMADNVELPTKTTTFPDGATSFELEIEKYSEFNSVHVTISSSRPNEVLWLQLLVAETLYEKCVSATRFTLHLPYFPFARADRAFNKNMVNARNTFVGSLDELWDEVSTIDLHSPSAEVTNIPVSSLCFAKQEFDVVVAPDKGAVKRAEAFAKGKPVVYCNKVRNVDTGWITDYEIMSTMDLTGKRVLIVDDICDGGMTFTICGNSLRKLGVKSLGLFVTHGIFSKGLQPFSGVFDSINCYQIVGNYITREELDAYND